MKKPIQFNFATGLFLLPNHNTTATTTCRYTAHFLNEFIAIVLHLSDEKQIPEILMFCDVTLVIVGYERK